MRGVAIGINAALLVCGIVFFIASLWYNTIFVATLGTLLILSPAITITALRILARHRRIRNHRLYTIALATNAGLLLALLVGWFITVFQRHHFLLNPSVEVRIIGIAVIIFGLASLSVNFTILFLISEKPRRW